MAKAGNKLVCEYRYSKLPEKRKRPKVKAKGQYNKIILSALVALFTIAATAILIKGLFVRIELAENNDLNVSLKKQVQSLQEDNTRLKIRYESRIDLDELEDYAKSELGMTLPSSEHIIEIDMKA